MPECIKCGKYAKYEKSLCYNCYLETKEETKDETDTSKSVKSNSPKAYKPNKFKPSNQNWVYNLIKGRIAETIVEELFLSLGFQVYKYGMENSIPGIMELLKGVKDAVAMEIRRMPDLVIYKDGKAHFIEVKFRASETFKLSDIDKSGDYPYQNALIVLVSKKHIKCLSFAELLEGKEISPKCKNYLGKRKEFETDNDKIVEYCDFAVKFFENV